MVNLKPKKIDKYGGMVFSKQPIKSSQHKPKLFMGVFVLCILMFFSGGVQATDTDGDGVIDSADAFPNDPALQSNPTITPNGLIKEIDRILGAHITIEGNTATYNQLQTTENVKLWLDASQVHANFGNPAVNDDVKTWMDLSGNNHHGQVEDTGKHPQFKTDQSFGEAIFFNPYTGLSNIGTTTGTAFRIPKFTGGLTKGEMYVVVRQHREGNTDDRKGFHTWSLARSSFVADTSNYLREGFGRNATTITTDGSNFGMLMDTYSIYNVSVSQNGKQIMRVQNIEKASADVTDLSWDNDVGTEDFDMIGAASVLDLNDQRIVHQWRKGYMKEIIFFDTVLSDTERAAMHYYLANKWNTSEKNILDSDGDGVEDASDYFPFDSTKHLADLSTEIDTAIGGGHNSASIIDDIEGDLLVWLDGKNINNKKNADLSGGDNITEWKDLSGNNNHANEDVTNTGPEFISSMNAVAFNGPYANQSSDRLIINDHPDLRIGQGAGKEFTIVLLYNAATDTNTRTLISKTSGNQTAHIDYAIFTEDTGDNNDFYYATGPESNSEGAYEFTEPAPDINMKNIAFATLKATAINDGANQLFLNGEKKFEVNYILKGASSDDPIYLGVRRVGYQEYIMEEYEGHLYEVLIFKKKLDDDERMNVTHYLAKKWAMTDTVDSDEDSFFDAEEITESTDPLDPNSIPTIDSDGDGVNDNVDAFPDDPAAAIDNDGDGYPDSIFSPYFTLQLGSGAGRALDYNPSNGAEYLWPSIVMSPSDPTFNTLDLAIQHVAPNGVILLEDGNYGMTEGTTKNMEIKRKPGATNVSVTLNARVTP